MNSPAPFTIALPTGQKALAIRPDANFNPVELAIALRLPIPSRLFMLSGGAGEMSQESYQQLRRLFQAIAGVLAETHTTVIDGGTSFGAVALLGEALAQAHHTAPYIGILPAHAEISRNGPTGEEVLEPHHSHFILVESNEWGEEVKLMYGLANYFSRQATSIALLVNGGSISLKEMEWNVKQGREVIVIAGSGRLADRIATAIRNPQTEIQEAELSSGKLTVFDLAEPVEGLVELLRQRLNSELSAQS